MNMNNILSASIGAASALGLAAATAAGVIHAGLIDVAADTPHHPAVHRLVEWARERAIARRSADLVPPADLSAAARVKRGAGNYDAMCAACHLAPGMADTEIRQGLYPSPPKLAEPPAAGADSDARRFWIIKHGIKASGMPAWSKGGMDDAAIWDLTAFLKALPGLSADDYRRLVAASPGHSHAGLAAPAAEQAGRRESNEAHAGSEAHAAHAHPHRAGAHAH